MLTVHGDSRSGNCYAALRVMDRHLRGSEFFSGGVYSIADMALYAYTHIAHEGGFSLKELPALRAWLDRVKTQPLRVAMDS